MDIGPDGLLSVRGRVSSLLSGWRVSRCGRAKGIRKRNALILIGSLVERVTALRACILLEASLTVWPAFLGSAQDSWTAGTGLRPSIGWGGNRRGSSSLENNRIEECRSREEETL